MKDIVNSGHSVTKRVTFFLNPLIDCGSAHQKVNVRKSETKFVWNSIHEGSPEIRRSCRPNARVEKLGEVSPVMFQLAYRYWSLLNLAKKLFPSPAFLVPISVLSYPLRTTSDACARL